MKIGMKFKNGIYVYFFIVSYLCSNSLFAQFDNLKFENYSTLEGLSSSTCVEIFQDSEGYLWFGTIDGLNKFDGYSFDIYRPVLDDPNSISNNRINSIVEDNDGNLWVGTGNGLNVFQKTKQKFYRIELYKDRKNSTVSTDVINDLLYDKITNTLWIANSSGVSQCSLEGVDQNSFDNIPFTHYQNSSNDLHSLDNNNAVNIVSDLSNRIWVVTEGAYLNAYNTKSDNFDRVEVKVTSAFALDHIPKLMLADSDGDFWIGNDLSKLVRWDRKSNSFELKSYADAPTPIFHMYQDKNGFIWIATDGYGIFIIDKDRGVTQHLNHNPVDPFSLPNDQPSNILEDKNGIFWIATYNKGVSKLALFKSSFGHYFHQPGNKNSLSTYIAQSVLEDEYNNIWIGTDGGGINLFDEKTNSFRHFFSDPDKPTTISSDKIIYLTESYDHHIWVCTWDGGLNKFDPSTKEAKRFLHKVSDPYSIGQNTVWCAVEDSQHRLWLGTQTAGLNVFDPESESFHSYTHDADDSTSLLSDFVFSTFIDSKSRLFVGTSLGLAVVYLNDLSAYIPEQIKFESIRQGKLQGYRINYIFEDKIGNIWVGSDLGLHKLSSELTFIQSYSIKEGMPNNLILGITEDSEGYIWATTKSGLTRLNPKTGELKNFNMKDGLQGMEFQSKSIDKTHDGRILVGGINGFNLFNPSEINTGSEKVTPAFTRFRLNNRVINVGDTVNQRVLLENTLNETTDLVLKYYERYISIEYVALHYQNPDRVQYAYKMIGLDDDYIEVGKTGSQITQTYLRVTTPLR